MADKDNESNRKSDAVVDSEHEKNVQLVDAETSTSQKDNVSNRHTANENAVFKSESEAPSIVKNAEFTSFLQLRDAIEKYQKENCVQLIVKDSKLLKAESTRKVSCLQMV